MIAEITTAQIAQIRVRSHIDLDLRLVAPILLGKTIYPLKAQLHTMVLRNGILHGPSMA